MPRPRPTGLRNPLVGFLGEVRDEQRRSRSSSPFIGTGFHLTGNNGIESDDFDGDIDANDPGTRGWSLNSVKAALGELLLRPGSIGNDALTNPVIPGSVWVEAQDFTVAPSWSNIISTNVTVPAGVTAAAISAKARVTAFYNDPAGDAIDYLYAHLYVAGNSSDYYPLAVSNNGGSGTNHVFRDVVLTGLTPGGTVNFTLQTSSDFQTWDAPSAPGNRAKLGASISWYR